MRFDTSTVGVIYDFVASMLEHPSIHRHPKAYGITPALAYRLQISNKDEPELSPTAHPQTETVYGTPVLCTMTFDDICTANKEGRYCALTLEDDLLTLRAVHPVRAEYRKAEIEALADAMEAATQNLMTHVKGAFGSRLDILGMGYYTADYISPGVRVIRLNNIPMATINMTGTNITVMFNEAYLGDILSYAEGAKLVRDGDKPVIIDVTSL